GVLVRGVLVVTLGVLVLEFFPRGVDETRVGEQSRTAVVGAPPVVRGGAFGVTDQHGCPALEGGQQCPVTPGLQSEGGLVAADKVYGLDTQLRGVGDPQHQRVRHRREQKGRCRQQYQGWEASRGSGVGAGKLPVQGGQFQVANVRVRIALRHRGAYQQRPQGGRQDGDQ